MLLPIRSRILAAKDGVKKLMSINKTIEKYGNYSASELVKITHNKLSPWSKVVSSSNNEINDELIKKYHRNEVI